MNKIALHSVPRSGSSWLGSLFDSSPQVAYRFQPLFSYSHKSQIDETSSKSAIDNFFSDIMNSKDKFVLQKQAISEKRVPEFSKTTISHIVYKEVRYHHIITNLLEKNTDIKIVGLLRSPFAVVNSWLNAPKEFRIEKGWKAEEEWHFATKKNLGRAEEFNGYNKWKEACFMFLKLKELYPNQFYLVNYDNLIKETVLEVKTLFQFCNIEYTQQTYDFIMKSTSNQTNDPYAVFKQKTNDLGWQSSLPLFIQNEIKNDPVFIKLNNQFQWI